MSGFLKHISDVEDVKSILNDICLKMYNYGRADGIAQGRRDAIEEFLNRIEDEGECGGWVDICTYKLEEIAEQMKGEQNE